MIEEMISEMATTFCRGVFTQRTSFRFILEDVAVTVVLDAESYEVHREATEGGVDCTCETSAEMFRKIWYDGYRPGIMDFLGGAIRCDNPLALPQFLRAFGR